MADADGAAAGAGAGAGAGLEVEAEAAGGLGGVCSAANGCRLPRTAGEVSAGGASSTRNCCVRVGGRGPAPHDGSEAGAAPFAEAEAEEEEEEEEVGAVPVAARISACTFSTLGVG